MIIHPFAPEQNAAAGISIEMLQGAILRMLEQRSAGASVCPSEIARSMRPESWRELMPVVRDAACALARAGSIEITQRDRVLAPDERLRGAIRLRKLRAVQPAAG